MSENTIVPPVLYFPVVEAADQSGPQFVVRGLSAVTIDVMDDLLATDVDIAEELRTLDQNLEAS